MSIERLTQKSVDRYVAAGVPVEIGDERTRGLFLRVRSTRWYWTYRRNVGRKDLRRDLGPDWTLEEARSLVDELNVIAAQRWPDDLTDEARFATSLGRKRARRLGQPYVPPKPPPEPETGVTLRDAQEAAWVEELRRTRRSTTAYTHDMALKVAEFVPLHDRHVDRVTRVDARRLAK